MPAKDTYHAAVKNALIKAGWTITNDPLTLSLGQKDAYVDLGAERVLGAERGSEKIAVEIKSFLSASDIRDLEVAVGQYVFYRSLLLRLEPSRKIFLAVPQSVYETTFAEPISRPVLEDMQVALILFDPQEETIIAWKP